LGSASIKTRTAALGLVVLVAVATVACSSTNSTTTTTTSGGSGGGSVPASAMSDHTGVTPTSIKVGNVSWLQIFNGAPIGAQAYFDMVNSQGGINGRKLTVDSGDDHYQGTLNKQLTQNSVNTDFAMVGNFSLQDSFGGQVLAQNPQMPDISVTLDLNTMKLPNVYTPAPAAGGWQEGPLQYFKSKYPNDINAVGTLVANQPSSITDWNGEKYAMEKVGYKVIYDQQYGVSQTDFTQNVIQMKNAGVKMLFVDQMAALYASSLLKNLQQQNFHPVVVLGAATYTATLIPSSGGPSSVNGYYLDQNQSLYLGEDASQVPAVSTFLHWVQVAQPGFQPDLFTLYGWLSAELFSQGLQNAGSDPSRGSLMEALNKITTFDGNHIIAPANPVAKTLSNCYLLGQIVNGAWTRLDDPPVNSSSNGYRCDYQYITPPSA
jgi:ABC-type branched-subunit amino acid transport system substrate-binding protein